MVYKKNFLVKSLLFIGAGAGEKNTRGAGQIWTGSATLIPYPTFLWDSDPES